MDQNTVITDQIVATKELRVVLDDGLQLLRAHHERFGQSRETALTVTKLQEGIMWLGMELKRLGTPNPYPNSYDPSNATVDPTADNLKL